MKALTLIICSSIILSACSKKTSEGEAVQEALRQAVSQSKALDGDFFLAVAWSEEGTETINTIQDLLTPYMVGGAKPRTLGSAFSPDTYNNRGKWISETLSGSGTCYIVWQEAPESRPELIRVLEGLNSSRRKSVVLIATESSGANQSVDSTK